MGSPSRDLACILGAADPITIELARGLLDGAGIPCLVHGPDFDLAELGHAAHDSTRRQDLFVPRSERSRALDILEQAWGERPVPPGDA